MDKPNVRLIVHMSMPLSIEDYWQKTGRARRDGDFPSVPQRRV